MSTHKVVLVNTSMGVTHGSVVVSGHSRKVYGMSRFIDKWKGHAFEMTMEAYAAAIPDIARNWHKSRCKWIPYFVEVEEPAKVVTPETSPELRQLCINSAQQLSTDDLKEILGNRNEMFHEETDKLAELTVSAVAKVLMRDIGIDISLPDRYWPLVKICENEGIEHKGTRKIPALQALIIAHRQKKAA